MPDNFSRAAEQACARIDPATWARMDTHERNAAIFHELCRLDSGCRRTGTAADAALPPCPASDEFIARRGCRFAGPR